MICFLYAYWLVIESSIWLLFVVQWFDFEWSIFDILFHFAFVRKLNCIILCVNAAHIVCNCVLCKYLRALIMVCWLRSYCLISTIQYAALFCFHNDSWYTSCEWNFLLVQRTYLCVLNEHNLGLSYFLFTFGVGFLTYFLHQLFNIFRFMYIYCMSRLIATKNIQ